MRIWAGFLCLGCFLPSATFNKPGLSVADQIQLLRSRGLIIADVAAATHHLEHISYYRLSGYALPFQNQGNGADRHNFKPGATFEAILERYNFDRQLRLVTMDAVERIEIAFRAALSNSIATRHGAHWYQDHRHFDSSFNHNKFLSDIKKEIGHEIRDESRRDVYIKHYYNKYSLPDMPPCWMIFESISFGTISIAFKNLIPSEFNQICREFNLPHHVLSSWLHNVSYIRNICAHHSRLWNRVCRIKPIAAKAYKDDLTPNDRVYAQFVVMQILLKKISPGNHWAQKLAALLAEHHTIPAASMGFPQDWITRQVWR